jgi:hypothetical protein
MDRDAATTPTKLLLPVAVVGAAVLLLGSVLALASDAVGERGAVGSALVDAKGVFWANQELNVWSWYSTLVLAALAAAFAVTAVLRRAGRRPYADSVVFACVATWLSIDEAAALHERLGTVARALGVKGTFEWVVLGLPVAIVGIAALAVVSRRTDPLLRRRLGVAALVFLGGSLGLEAVAGTLVETWGLSKTAPLFILEVTLEEATEVAGVLLALRAVLADLRVGIGPQGLVVRSVPPAEERSADTAPTRRRASR